MDPETSCFFSLTDVFVFGSFVWAGFYFRRKRDAHQRLMLFATVCALLPSAIGRWPVEGGKPALASPIIFAFVLVGPTYDLITRRRVHPAYGLGFCFFLLTSPPVRILLGKTEAWHHFVRWVVN
jgi:hypothetical protein